LVINHLNSRRGFNRQLIASSDRFDDFDTIDVTVGQTTGTRLYRLQIGAALGNNASGNDALFTSLFSIYVVDPADPQNTLIDRGIKGTSVFSLSPSGVELATGLVRWDGDVVEIDLGSIENLDTARLRFQLLSNGRDSQASVSLFPLTNEVDLTLQPGQLVSAPETVLPSGGPMNIAALSRSEFVDTNLRNVRFDQLSGSFVAEVEVENLDTAIGRDVAIVVAGLPQGASLSNASGATSQGLPYLNLREAVPNGGLGRNSHSKLVELRINNPEFRHLDLTTEIYVGPANRQPSISPIANQTVMPGDSLTLDIPATDADGDKLIYSLLSANGVILPTAKIEAGSGRIKFSPNPLQLGNYEVQVLASDGALIASRSFQLSVIDDPIKTTRVSGKVLDVNMSPIAGIVVEVGGVQGLTQADGRFLLDLGAGQMPSDTLKIRGENYTDPQRPNVRYPFIAEKLPFMLGREVFQGYNNVLERPIYLPKLNPGVAVNPSAITTVSAEVRPDQPPVQVRIAAGTLLNQQGAPYSGNLSITEVPPELTPAALPPNLRPDFLITIQPGEMAFSTPAPLTVPNTAEWPSDTAVDLYSINPVTGEFNIVGKGRVGYDGKISTTSGGIRNSSWHFFVPAPPPVTPTPPPTIAGTEPSLDEYNQDVGCNTCTATTLGTSEVELHSGAVIESHSLPAYQSLGTARSVTLVYDSLRADPRPVIHFGFTNVPNEGGASELPKRNLVGSVSIDAQGNEYVIAGYQPVIGLGSNLRRNEHVWEIPNEGGSFRVALQADLSQVPTGIYQYTINSGVLSRQNDPRILETIRFSGSTTNSKGSLVHLNSISSPIGAGWGIVGLHYAERDIDGDVLLVNGDGSELVFRRSSQNDSFLSPPGDFSRLQTTSTGGLRRTLPNGSVQEFNSAGRLITDTDRQQNQTSYFYDSQGRLTRIVDPVGLQTSFRYNQGRLSEVEDPAGRISHMQHDADGNLIQIQDPDGSTRRWQYDNRHLMTGEIDQRGLKESMEYSSAGRARRATLKDGTTRSFSPVQTQLLLPSTSTTNPYDPPLAPKASPPRTQVIDESGRVVTSQLDRAGQVTQEFDAFGPLPTVQRNAQNLVVSTQDGRGNRTYASYDAQGNQILAGDDLSVGPHVFPNPIYVTEPSTYTGSSRDEVILAGDLTNDGLPDLIVNQDQLLPNLGNREFGRPSQLPIQGEVMAIGDLNNDNLQDLVTIGFNGIRSYLNRGGTWEPAALISEFPRQVELDDINADGILDLVFETPFEMAVRLGIGDGTWGQSQMLYDPPTGAVGQVVDWLMTDVTADQKADLVAWLTVDSTSTRIAVWPRTGPGQFATQPTPFVLPGGDSSGSIRAGDLDADGDVDLVVQASKLRVLLANGQGGWTIGEELDAPGQLAASQIPGRLAAIEDINADGRLDLITTLGNALDDRDFRIFLGRGDGTLMSGVSYGTFNSTDDPLVLVQDLDGDQHADVALASSAISTHVFYGNSWGGLDDQTYLAEGFGISRVALGDLNGDGLADFVSAEPIQGSSLNRINVQIAEDNGVYRRKQSFDALGYVAELQLRDLEADGDLDLIILSQRSGDQTSNALGIYSNSSQGAFAEAPNAILLDVAYKSFLFGDLNGDQRLDVVLTADATIATKYALGQISGGFSALQALPNHTNHYNSGLGVGDVDGDGDDDILITGNTGNGGDSIFFLSKPTPTGFELIVGPSLLEFGGGIGNSVPVIFSDIELDGDKDLLILDPRGNQLIIQLNTSQGWVAELIPLGYWPDRMLVGDMNGDNLPEVLVTIEQGRSVMVLPNVGGQLQLPQAFNLDNSGDFRPADLAMGDLNGDGIPDVAVVENGERSNHLTLIINHAGQLGAAPLLGAMSVNRSSLINPDFELGDVNGDGLLDWVSATVVAINDGAEGVASQFLLPPLLPPNLQATSIDAGATIALQDFNGDAKLDLVRVIGYRYDFQNFSEAQVFLGDGSGKFSKHFSMNLISGVLLGGLAVGDLNGDGVPDIVTANRNNTSISVLLGNGDGTFGNAVNTPSTIAPMTLTLGDVDGNGTVDVIASDGLNILAVFQNAGDATFPNINNHGVPFYSRPHAIRVRDLNNDGLGDIIAAPTFSDFFGSSYDGGILVLIASGGGNFLREEIFGGGIYCYDLEVVDVNGDGILDIITSDLFGTLRMLRGKVEGGFEAEELYQLPYASKRFAVGDLDLDGDLDIALGVGYRYGSATAVIANRTADSQQKLTYDPQFNQLTSSRDELGQLTLFDRDPTNGNLLAERRVVAEVGGDDDQVTSFEYDSRGQITAKTNSRGQVTRYQYDAQGRLTLVTDADGSPQAATRSFTYDAAGNVASETDERGNATQYQYDAHNRLIRRTDPDPDGAGPLPPPVTSWQFDSAGNVIRQVDALGGSATFIYDARNRMTQSTDTAGKQSSWRYDATGNLLSSTVPLGHTTQFEYDSRQRQVAMTNANGAMTRYRYDVDNNLIAMEDSRGNLQRYEYDSRNRLIGEIDTLGAKSTRKYDLSNRLIELKDRNGQVTRWDYDRLNRPIQETWLSPAGEVLNTVQRSFDQIGNLTSISDRFSALTFNYDTRNRISRVDTIGTPGMPAVVLDYAYDPTDNVVSVSESIAGGLGTTTSYAYDPLNRISSIHQADNQQTGRAVDVAYNALGQYQSITRFADLQRSRLVARSQYAYDSAHRLNSVQHGSAQNARDLAFFDLEFDAASRITAMIDSAGRTDFQYDQQSQLQSAQRSAADPRGNESYRYDAVGNRTSSHLHGSDYVTGDGNQLLSDGANNYVYDAVGNLIGRANVVSGQTRALEYDHRQRLVSVTDRSSNGTVTQLVQFVYDALDRRIAKTVDLDGVGPNSPVTQYMTYDRNHILLQFTDADGPTGSQAPALSTRFLIGPGIDQTLAQTSSGGETRWMLADHLGTVRLAVDDAGKVASSWRLDSWGRWLDSAGANTPLSVGLTGREFDAELGLYYFRARYYDPNLGRFISQDPLGLQGGDTNFYRYVENQPLVGSDPFGLEGVFISRFTDVAVWFGNQMSEFVSYRDQLADQLSDKALEYDGVAGICRALTSGSASSRQQRKDALDLLSLLTRILPGRLKTPSIRGFQPSVTDGAKSVVDRLYDRAEQFDRQANDRYIR
jgi:RHS repeat-associated protein